MPQALPNKTTAPDTPDLQARHVRGRTIYALPDRVAYGYFDMLTRLIVESSDWSAVETVPLVAPSRDFRAMKLQLEAMAAAKRRDSTATNAAADELERLAGEPGQHPLAQTIITLQAREAPGLAALAAGDESRVLEMMDAAVAIEDSIEALTVSLALPRRSAIHKRPGSDIPSFSISGRVPTRVVLSSPSPSGTSESARARAPLSDRREERVTWCQRPSARNTLTVSAGSVRRV